MSSNRIHRFKLPVHHNWPNMNWETCKHIGKYHIQLAMAHILSLMGSPSMCVCEERRFLYDDLAFLSPQKGGFNEILISWSLGSSSILLVFG